MIKRTKILRICVQCKKEEFIRKDGYGIRCRSCRATLNCINRIGKYKDISNQRFGRLIATEVSHKLKQYFWNCICDCGNKVIISGNKLRSGKTKSCGCIVKKQHGLSQTPTYRSWKAMIQRCYDNSVDHYKNYGFIGITVCERWRNSFFDFLEDMGERPAGKTLDRIDPIGNYEQSNCRWAIPKDQANNKKNNFIIEALGKKQTLQQWADEYKINGSLLRQRLIRDNWNIEKALTYKRIKRA